MPIIFILCYNGSVVTRTIVTLTAVKSKSLYFYVLLRLVVCYEHVHHDYA